MEHRGTGIVDRLERLRAICLVCTTIIAIAIEKRHNFGIIMLKHQGINPTIMPGPTVTLYARINVIVTPGIRRP